MVQKNVFDCSHKFLAKVHIRSLLQPQNSMFFFVACGWFSHAETSFQGILYCIFIYNTYKYSKYLYVPPPKKKEYRTNFRAKYRLFTYGVSLYVFSHLLRYRFYKKCFPNADIYTFFSNTDTGLNKKLFWDTDTVFDTIWFDISDTIYET